VDIDWPEDFGRWLDRLEGEARSGDERSRLILTFTARALDQLRNLTDPPTPETETATLRWVRQSRAISCGASRTRTIRRQPSG
jgi:hypothetical protein